ncbi:MAG: discoidin domain-containing protein, partial [Candidatus Theseobacter exili]|nr:discoidin domain-containing protein [Candidatus Theseobacter exili]
TLSNCDIATRTKAYADITGDPAVAGIGAPYAQFLADKYRYDGAIWAGYHYETGDPKWYWDSLDVYAFAAKLFIQHEEFDLAERIIREKILSRQHLTPCDPYYGAIMEATTDVQAQQSRYKDAAAFSMLESMMALQEWLAADKGTWESSYPGEWTTVETVTGGDGGEDILEFSSVQARYVRILCNQRINPGWGYSLFNFKAYGWAYTFIRKIPLLSVYRTAILAISYKTKLIKTFYPYWIWYRPFRYEKNYAYNKTGSVSSVQLDEWDYHPVKNAFDAYSSTRWASKGGTDAEDPQWIYVDLGSTRSIHKVKLLWENAYATDYEVQVAVPASEE